MFTQDFSSHPLWIEGQPNPTSDTMPLRCDVVVVGAGYTGLNAALEIARAGRHVVVLDALEPGGGCSSRNGGQVSPEVEYEPGSLAKSHGKTLADAMIAEGKASVDWLEDFTSQQHMSCDFQRNGHYMAAHSPKAFKHMAASADALGAEVVERADQRRELGSDAYFGGLVLPGHGALDPAKYVNALVGAVRNAGGVVVGGCRVQKINRHRSGYSLLTSIGAITTNIVVIATNGYSENLVPWLARRVVPIGSYVIATEPLDPSLISQTFPTGRCVTDSRRVIYYYRPSPDGKRMIFGGRVSSGETDTLKSGRRLHREMTRLFPQFSQARISHSWMGYVAFTFDALPHTGTYNGMHYSMGYCGSGVAMASYLGMKLGKRVVGQRAGQTPFEQLSHPKQAFYTGRPWLLPAIVSWYRAKDFLDVRMASSTP